jgi:hypothetical protein
MVKTNWYDLNSLHYNKKGVPQVAPEKKLENLVSAWNKVNKFLKDGEPLERNMLFFFDKHVNQILAYRDNDVQQGSDGPQRLFVVGRMKSESANIPGLFIRIGVTELIPALQALYLQKKPNGSAGSDFDPDAWVYEFTDRYQGRIEGMGVKTNEGIKSLGIIPVIHESLMTGKHFYFNKDS